MIIPFAVFVSGIFFFNFVSELKHYGKVKGRLHKH